jgi:hypothetical protein
MKTPPLPTSAKPAARRFFEVFGDAVSENIFLRNLAVALTGACIIQTFGVLKLTSRPPMVIRVDNIGEPVAYDNVRVQNAVTGPEVRNFAEHFTRYLLGWDCYSLTDDVNRALHMMTLPAAQKMIAKLDGMKAEPWTKDNSVRTSVKITQIEVEKDAPAAVRVKVRGTRTYASYNNKDFHQETTFEDTFVAQKVDRSLKTPWGLLVEEWQESIFKETQTP